jgi:hypothetical protein
MRKWLGILSYSFILAACGAANQAEKIDGPYARPSIVNGTTTEIQPLIRQTSVAITREGKPTCSGVIVGPQTLLTAQHCFVSDPAPEIYQIAFEGLQTDQPWQTREIATIEFYAKDINGLPSRTYFPLGDIALIRWQGTDFEGSRQAPLADDNFVYRAGMPMLIAGFGSTSVFDSEPAKTLKQGSTFLQKAFTSGPFRGLLTYGGGPDGACIGGPAFIKGPNGLMLVGLTQGINPNLNTEVDFLDSNDNCTFKAGVYTMVSYYGRWLKSLGLTLDGQYKRSLDQKVSDLATAEDVCTATDLSLQDSYNVRRFMQRLRLGNDCSKFMKDLAEIRDLVFQWEGPSDLGLVRFMPQLQILTLHYLEAGVSLAGLGGHENLRELSLRGTRLVKQQAVLRSLTKLKRLSWIIEGPLGPSLYPQADPDTFQKLPDSLETLELMRIRLHSLGELPRSLQRLKVTGAGLQGSLDLSELVDLREVDLTNNSLRGLAIGLSNSALELFAAPANLLEVYPDIESPTIQANFSENPLLQEEGYETK